MLVFWIVSIRKIGDLVNHLSNTRSQLTPGFNCGIVLLFRTLGEINPSALFGARTPAPKEPDSTSLFLWKNCIPSRILDTVLLNVGCYFFVTNRKCVNPNIEENAFVIKRTKGSFLNLLNKNKNSNAPIFL